MNEEILKNETIKNLISDLERKVNNNVLEKNNFDFLLKLLSKAESVNEAMNICSLGTIYNKTGLHYENKSEKETELIHYLKKDENLSFDIGGEKHKLIIGDNYPALKNLLIEYRNSIDIIYIDPPYGMDENGEFAKTNYENRITRDNLLSMMHPRLELAKQLLSSHGVIFCSIDDRNYAYLKCLFDDVFQEYNFINTMVWHSNKSIMKGSQYIRKDHEYILVYAKDKNDGMLIFNKLENNMSFSNPDNDPKGPWFSSNATYKLNPESPNYYGIKLPNGETVFRTWRFSEKEYNDGKIPLYFNGSNVPRIKIYESETNKNSSIPSTIIPDERTQIIDDAGSLTTAKTELNKIIKSDFETPKPVNLIKYILEIAAKNDSVILDFFAGSGTTGEAVLQFNKETKSKCKFILVTNNEKGEYYPNGVADDVTTKRLKRIMTGKCYDGTDDFEWLKKNLPYLDSLDVYRLETANVYDKDIFNKIDEKNYGENFADNIKNKIDWVCKNFEQTTRILPEEDK